MIKCTDFHSCECVCVRLYFVWIENDVKAFVYSNETGKSECFVSHQCEFVCVCLDCAGV